MVHHKRRIQWLDFAKGVTIFFVLMGHVLMNVHPSLKMFKVIIKVVAYFIPIFIMPVFLQFQDSFISQHILLKPI